MLLIIKGYIKKLRCDHNFYIVKEKDVYLFNPSLETPTRHTTYMCKKCFHKVVTKV
mgnify:CR=1 FL=1